MSVRAIAIRSGPRQRVAAASPRVRDRHPRRAAWWTSFTDDRRFLGAKLMLIGLLVLTAMALEVPW